MKYLYEVYERLPRCGPGGDPHTRRAYEACGNVPECPRILDIGCGPGAQSLELARLSKGTVLALDNHRPFLDTLEDRARETGLSGHIETVHRSMLEMDFSEASFDLIWSEGALYFLGFESGLKTCHRMLKPGGAFAATEAVYIQPDIPPEVSDFWDAEYPDIASIDEKCAVVERSGLTLIDHFTLPAEAWIEQFYAPMAETLDEREAFHHGNTAAMEALAGLRSEIAFFDRYSDFYGYEFFVAQKPQKR